MRVRTDGVHSNIITAVSFLEQWNRRRLLEKRIVMIHEQRIIPPALVEVLVKSHSVCVRQREVRHFIFGREVVE